uniref:Ral transcription factor IIIC subunit 5 n=1 Tax=Fundulus heteroclitus TaxID=8078 RepID=A0A3Q2PKC9_FUNHE
MHRTPYIVPTTADAGGSSAVELRDKKLVCVEYPAVVTSVDRMLETLGGEQTVSKTYSDPNRRLELHFRPQDPFCHSLCGNRLSSRNLLLRVRRRVRKKDPKDAQIQMDVVGIIGTTYKFQGMADFQCLAVDSQDGKTTSLYDKIILRKAENQAFFEQDVPYFLPPAIFSRLDNPVDYFYRTDVIQNPSPGSKNFIGLNRARRPHNAIFVSFTDPTVPDKCLEAARANWDRLCLTKQDQDAEEKVKKMFESRPIWSGNAVKANLNVHREKLKLLLPVYAYYMVSQRGPSLLSKNWLFVQLHSPSPRFSLPQESAYIFREGLLPPHRQMFYQLCDLDVIDQNNGEEQTCDERDGWCVVGTTDKLRDIISTTIKKTVREQNPGMNRTFLQKEEEDDEAGECENKEDEEENEEDEFQPSEGSENEMETEILDYM